MLKKVDTTPSASNLYLLNKQNNFTISIKFLKSKGVFDSIRVKLADTSFEDGPRRPCFLRVSSKTVLSECQIKVNGWYLIHGPFEFSDNEVLTFACISIWGEQIAGLQGAKIEAVEFNHRIELWGQTLDTTSFTDGSTQMGLHSVDPLGITVQKVGYFMKLIRSNAFSAWKTVFQSSTFSNLTIAGIIIPSKTLETGSDYFTHAVISKPVWGPSYLITFHQAKCLARQVIYLMNELISQESDGFCLIDAHTGNFAQTGAGMFSLLDFGSIVKFDQNSANGGLESLIKMILMPLAICARGDNLSFGQSLHLSAIGIEIDGQVVNKDDNLQIIIDTFQIPLSGFGWHEINSASEFNELFIQLNHWIDSLIQDTRTDFWSNYQTVDFPIDEISQSMQWLVDPNQEISSFADRDRTVIELLSAMNYNSLIDLGCNAGKFSIYASLLGYQVSAIDSNEQVIDALFDVVTSEGLPISLFYGSVFDENFRESCEADVVLALALTHHLMLGDHSPALQDPKSMDDVCALISGLAKKAALIEFMPLGIGSAVNNFSPLPNPLPDWYNKDNFELTLSKYFSTVTKVEYSGEVSLTRVLFVCEKEDLKSEGFTQ